MRGTDILPPMIRVAVDGRRLQDRPLTGVGRSLACLLPHLAGGADLTVLTDRRRPPGAAEGSGARTVALPGFGAAPETVWLQAGVAAWLARRPGTVFHGTFNAVPVATRRPCVVTIHDLAWLHHPEDLPGAKRAVFAASARWAARHAAVVVTVSEFTRQAIAEAYGVGPDRLVVAPNAVAPGFGPERAIGAEELLGRMGIRPPYVLAIGGARRRGLSVALEAWRRATAGMGADRPQMVVVGDGPLPPEPGVIGLGRLEDDEWAVVLAAAEVLCYPTRFEGFGMPALEAAASGTPVVCAPVAALPEVMGDAAEWASGTGVEPVAEALGRVLSDDGRRADLRRRGLERAAAAPGWVDIARILLDAYGRAAE